MQIYSWFPTRQRHFLWGSMPIGTMFVLLIILGSRLSAQAQPFTSGSTGADGALTLTTPGTIIFDPRTFNPPLDPDGDNIYNFTTITIGAGVTVRLTATHLNGPVFWLASGAVQINGVIDLNGENGQGPSPAGVPFPALPGAGGFAGGVEGQPGNGPFGGFARLNPAGGRGPGNGFLVPLLGGSGGGSFTDGAGGAGGGALLVASSVSITINGTITANGGEGTYCTAGGGGGGGGIRLVTPTISGVGSLTARGGSWLGCCANCSPGPASGAGVIRLEAFEYMFTGTTAPTRILASPFGLFLPSTPPPSLRVVSVAGVPVATDPTGSFTMPDVTINSAVAVPAVIEAHNIPSGTVVKLHVFSENGPDQIVDSPPLAGTLALSTATASVVLPPGFSRGFVRATWTP